VSNELNPKNVESRIRLGTIYYSHHEELEVDPSLAIVEWTAALKLNQNNPETFYCLALFFYTRRNEADKAFKLLERAILAK
jgi:tetratricopeptide (TPR) repeat protein